MNNSVDEENLILRKGGGSRGKSNWSRGKGGRVQRKKAYFAGEEIESTKNEKISI